ncbi:MAG: hypothetical protein WB767_11555, partial [Nocardioides sp.]
MAYISCPVCAGPVEFVGERPRCLVGHAFTPEDLSRSLGEAASRALWSALRALEDSVASAQWRLTQPSPPANAQAIVEEAEREAALVRTLLTAREGRSSD